MNYPTYILGSGELCPIRSIRNFSFASLLLFIFLLASSQTTFAQSSTMQTSITLPASSGISTNISTENWLSAQGEFAETWLTTETSSDSDVLTVTLHGLNYEVPSQTEIGRVTVAYPNETYAYILIADGGTVMIVIDDF